jgi:hypothetical protein
MRRWRGLRVLPHGRPGCWTLAVDIVYPFYPKRAAAVDSGQGYRGVWRRSRLDFRVAGLDGLLAGRPASRSRSLAWLVFGCIGAAGLPLPFLLSGRARGYRGWW